MIKTASCITCGKTIRWMPSKPRKYCSINCIKPIAVGARFNRLVVLNKIPQRNGRLLMYECLCDCGRKTTAISNHLRVGKKQSCGCIKNHFHSRTRIYKIWTGMILRCHQPKTINYHNYGGRGIQVCDRWRNSFRDFLADMGEPPTKKHSIDRVNNDGNYEPSNCKWSTRKEQNNNRRGVPLITFHNITQSRKQWAEMLGINYSILLYRLKTGWDFAKAVTTPGQKQANLYRHWKV